MMSYINETDFVIENKELVYPEIVTDGLQLYYDAKGKRDTDYHRDTMLDMSGNENHGKLHNFAYEKHSGYKDGLVFDYIDDKLVRPALDGIDANNFTYQLNSNILAFTGGEVRTVKNGNVEVGKRNYWAIAKKPWHSHLAYQGDGVFTNNNTDFAFAIFRMDKLEVPVGETYTLSFEINVSDDAIQFGNDRFYINGEAPNGKHNKPTLVKDKWVKVYATFNYTVENTRLVHIYINGIPSKDTFQIRNFKLEKGNIATDWIPAPEDLIETTDLKGNILGDMEDIIDGLYKTEVLSGEEIYTDRADDSAVHVDVDGKSVGGGSGKNLILNSDFQQEPISYQDRFTEVERGYNHFKYKTMVSANTGPIFTFSEHLKPNTEYTLSFDIHSETGKPLNYLSLRSNTSPSSSGISLGLLPNQDLTSGWNSVIISLKRGIGEAPTNGVWIGTRLTEEEDYIIKNLQLEEGNKRTDWEPPAPSPDYPIEIHSLNDFDVVSSVGKKNLVINSDEPIKLGGRNEWGYISSTIYRMIEPNEKNSTYTLSIKMKGSGRETNLVQPHILGTYLMGSFNVTDEYRVYTNTFYTSNAQYQNIYFYGSGIDSIEVEWIKIEKGNTATPYSPALEDTTEDDNHPLIDKINLSLSEPLRSVGDVKDRLFRDSDGLWKVERNIGVSILNGSESWVEYGTTEYKENNNVYTISGLLGYKLGYQTSITSHLVNKNLIWANGNTDYYSYSDHSTVRTKYFRLPLDVSLSEWKNWLSENPVTFQGQLETPIIETLDQELQDKLNNLRTFEDSNYVYTIINDKTDNFSDYVSDNLKPTLHAKFLYNDWYKEDRVINNLMIYNRALTNEEMLQNYKTIKRRWRM